LFRKTHTGELQKTISFTFSNPSFIIMFDQTSSHFVTGTSLSNPIKLKHTMQRMYK
jgi:hypothetical protein